jgi:uncharacterized protein (TIGR00645 family)
MKTLERAIERLILASRWILVVFYVGLGLSLAIYAVSFVRQFVETTLHGFDLDESGMILAMLGLIDAALVASLIVMVMISSYENFVSRFEDADSAEISWLGKLDAGSLKVKVASSIVAISSIHLLKAFMNIEHVGADNMFWLVVGHVTFVVSALLMAVIDRISVHAEGAKAAH